MSLRPADVDSSSRSRSRQMKRVSTFALLLALALALCAADVARGQAGARPRTAEGAEKEGKGVAGTSEAEALYEEASRYAQNKFDEFRKKNVPYDPLLEQKTLQEQRDLALQPAARLAARAPLGGTDLYYSGLLYTLAGKGEGALDSMRKFLAEESKEHPDLRQRARSVVAQQAAQFGLPEEAERVLAEYAKSEPRTAADLHR